MGRVTAARNASTPATMKFGGTAPYGVDTLCPDPPDGPATPAVSVASSGVATRHARAACRPWTASGCVAASASAPAPAPAPARATSAPGPWDGRRARKQPMAQAQQGRLGVAHDEYVGGGGQAEKPDGPTGHRGVAGLAANQDVEQHRGHIGRHIRHDQQCCAVPHPRQPGHSVGQGRDGREEAQRLRPQGAVAHTCDRLVVPGVPAEQPLVHPGGHTHVDGWVPVHDEVGQGEDAQHDHPGQHERQERLAGGPDAPTSRRRCPGPVCISRTEGRTR